MDSWKTNGPWLYRVLRLSDRIADQERDLGYMGQTGWELVSVTHDPDGDGRVAYFKKPAPTG